MSKQPPELGTKTALYPHGYGFCQCGCGQQTKPSPNGIYPMYLSKSPSAASPGKSARDSVLREIYQLKLQQESASLNIKTIMDDLDRVTKFVKDFWNSTDHEKEIALDRLTRILQGVKSLNNASAAPLSTRATTSRDKRDEQVEPTITPTK